MPYIDVHGRCPACGTENLHLATMSCMLICLAPHCPDKFAAHRPLLPPKIGAAPPSSWAGMIPGAGLHSHRREGSAPMPGESVDHSHLGGEAAHEHSPEERAADELTALTEELGLYGERVLRCVAYDPEDGEATLEDRRSPQSRVIRLAPAELADYEAARERWLLWQARLWGVKGEHETWLTDRTVEEDRAGE
jgi:hypothetical protein